MKPAAIWKPAAKGNYASGRRLKISQITFHHIVGDAGAAIARFQKDGEEVSSTYVISSTGVLYQCVADSDTPYTDANSDSNARSITIEHAGGHPSVPYTEAMYQTSIELTAWLIKEYGIQSFKRHRDVSSKPTACPGDLDVERIVKAAQGEDMSKIDFERALQEAEAHWGWHERLPERDDILKRDIVGRETNEVLEFMYNHEWGVTWRNYRNFLMTQQSAELANKIEAIRKIVA